MVAIIFFEENASELFRRGEAEQQDCESSSLGLSSSSDRTAKDYAATATQLRRNDEDNLRRDELTEDDHGNKFISDDYEFFEAAVQRKKRKCEILNEERDMLKEEEAYDEDTCWYDGSTATTESYDEECRGSTFMGENELTYEQEFTNSYERSNSY
ncbi:hypothetical protein ACHAXA_004078 [Cyclostephanos tholiformis]|jgi:hypothetical protein|uniref:Uncharacterized protein n=1 Tax=Cyclostephanos tholiformis TaxID=382380 RepID=A0ABD3RF68_9STRA